MATKKIYIDDEIFGLGAFGLPILTVNERMEILRKINPQMGEQERAAVAYFGMLADTPKPTAKIAFYWSPENLPIENWLDLENDVRYSIDGFYIKSVNGINIIKEERDAAAAYLNKVYLLQKWLQNYGLWEGIQKTLNEQSRKKQAEKAANDESKAAAARALAYAQITEDMSEEARREAAEAQGRAQDQLNAALAKEEQLKKELENLANGLPADFGKVGGISWPLVIGAGALAYILLKKEG